MAHISFPMIAAAWVMAIPPEGYIACVSGQSPSAQSGLQVAVGILQLIVTALLAFFLWRLTFIMFVRNAEQKIKERQAEWYHKVVIDPQLKALNDFHERASAALSVGAEGCEAAKVAAKPEELDRIASHTITDFNRLLLPAQRELSDLVNCFNQALAQRCADRFADLQDAVTEWFEALRQAAAVDARISLPSVLSSFRSDMVSLLRNFEFTAYGFERPSLLRSLLWW